MPCTPRTRGFPWRRVRNQACRHSIRRAISDIGRDFFDGPVLCIGKYPEGFIDKLSVIPEVLTRGQRHDELVSQGLIRPPHGRPVILIRHGPADGAEVFLKRPQGRHWRTLAAPPLNWPVHRLLSFAYPGCALGADVLIPSQA